MKPDDKKSTPVKNPNLTDEQYNICFLKGTEPPFSGKYLNNNEPGIYNCANCGQKLFSSDTKFKSEGGLSGWPSFRGTYPGTNIKTQDDDSFGMIRTEVVCGNCGAHLGHLFQDGPGPNDAHYCINSLALDFKPKSS